MLFSKARLTQRSPSQNNRGGLRNLCRTGAAWQRLFFEPLMIVGSLDRRLRPSGIQ